MLFGRGFYDAHERVDDRLICTGRQEGMRSPRPTPSEGSRMDFATGAIFATTVAASASAALAEHDFMQGLALLLAAEKPCALVYDHEAIAKLIEKNVPAGSLSFAVNLRNFTSMQQQQFDSLTSSELTARCWQVRRSAKTYRLID
jgi:hypothetical protein